jgi:membrane carboxypeptidase/penicillin-binding protein
LAVLTFVAVGGLCCWLFFYAGDLPATNQLSEFAPKAAGHNATDACLAGSSFAIPFDRIGKPFQDALTSAEPSNTYADEIARTLMCNKHESPAKYQLSVFRLSCHIRRRFSEQELLTIYANRAYFGPTAIGVDNASRQFFQKEVNALSVEEAALLAGTLRAPAIYSPFRHSDLALRRRNQILATMAAQGKLSATELERAMAAPLSIQPSTPD